MQLIDEGFARWYRKYSVIALALIGALNTVWVSSPEIHEMLSAKHLAIANGILAALGAFGRFIKQTQALIDQEQP